MQNLVGTTLGQYQIVQEIGRGGMAVVYKAYQPSLTRYVAIKVLPPQFSFDQDFIERFVREARGAAMLHHPNIITIHDVSEQDGVHYFVMEYLTGKTLDLVLAQTPMPPPRIVHIIRQVAGALDHAHSQGLIHRDIKPSNISVDEVRNDHVVLMDFGLVRAGQDSKLTKTGMIVGTPEYMSPEQAQGEEVDYRTDLYSLGVVLYRMLTGTAPFVRSTPAAVLLAHVAYEPLPVSQINPTVPKSVEAVVLKAMAKDRNRRYQSAGELARDLSVAITGQMPTGLEPQAVRTTTLPAPPPMSATILPTVISAPTTPPPSAAILPTVVSAPTTPPPLAPTTHVPVPPAPVEQKRAGATSPVVLVGLGAAALVVLCAIGFLAAAALGVFKIGVKATVQPTVAASPTTGVTLLTAPNLKEPADGATLSPKDAITLAWEPVSGLSPDDAYVVTLDCGAPQTATVKETSYVVPSSLRASLAAPYQCRWSVAMMAQDGTARSQPSSTRQFVWNMATATPMPPSPATATLVTTPTSTPSSVPTSTPRPVLPTSTPVLVRATPTVACTGDRVWNGSACVCPPDKPDWTGSQCIPKEKGGGGKLPPPPP